MSQPPHSFPSSSSAPPSSDHPPLYEHLHPGLRQVLTSPSSFYSMHHEHLFFASAPNPSQHFEPIPHAPYLSLGQQFFAAVQPAPNNNNFFPNSINSPEPPTMHNVSDSTNTSSAVVHPLSLPPQPNTEPPITLTEESSSRWESLVAELNMTESGHKCICLEYLKVGEKAIKLSCNHFYHRDCIAKWMDTKGNCPYCRCQVVPVDDDDEDDNYSKSTSGTDSDWAMDGEELEELMEIWDQSMQSETSSEELDQQTMEWTGSGDDHTNG